MDDLFTGKLVRLTAFDPERGGELLAKWYRDSEFSRMYDLPPVMVRDPKRTQEELREEAGLEVSRTNRLLIRTLADDVFIGEVELDVNGPTFDEGFIGIGLGERAYWGKGYGTDAMRLIIAFGFREWNLHRVSLTVFSYNARAMHVYTKLGFREEGRCRQQLRRGGERFDVVFMGILRKEWETGQYGH